jgi:hypothetical protein
LPRSLAGPLCWKGDGNGFRRRLGFARGFGQLFPTGRNDLSQMFGQIFRSMPPIGHMLGLGMSCAESGSKLLTPIPRDDVERWGAFQPLDDGLLGTLGEQSNRLLAFQIHDQSPIAVTALPGPLVTTNDRWRSDGRERKSMHEAQDRSRSRLHPLAGGAACSGCPTLFPTKLTEGLAKTEGKATLRPGHLREPLGEDAPRTSRPITGELADVQMQEDLHVLPRQVPDAAFRAAMDPMSGSATPRTGGALRYPFTGEDQALGLSAVGKQAEVAKMRKEDMEREGNTP